MKGLAALTGLRGWPEGGGPAGKVGSKRWKKGVGSIRLDFGPNSAPYWPIIKLQFNIYLK